MATDDTVSALPGDVIQDSQGQLYLVAETHRWGVGAVQRWRDGDEEREAYYRLKPDQYAVVGRASLLPEEVAGARRDALRTARLLAREAGAERSGDSADPFQWAANAASAAVARGEDPVVAIARAGRDHAALRAALVLENDR